MGKKKYFTEEERKTAKKEKQKRYRERHKEHLTEYITEWRKNNPKYDTQRRSTPYGRAVNLLSAYKQNDKIHNRGECTITAEWIVENIFSQPCHYCGESDWTKLGADRKDSSLPHTPENCVPCCKHCNDKKHITPYDDYIKIIKSGGSPTS